MTPKEIKKKIEALLVSGKSYNAVQEELSVLFPRRELDLARLIADIPSLAQRTRFAAFRKGLMVLILVLVVLQLVHGFVGMDQGLPAVTMLTFVAAAVFVFFVFGISKWSRWMWIAISGLSFGVATFVFRYGGELQFGILGWIEAGFAGLIGLIGQYVGWQLGGKYSMTSTHEKDAQGRIWARHKIKFHDQQLVGVDDRNPGSNFWQP